MARKIALLVPIQPSASAVMTRLARRRQALSGTSSLRSATVKSTVHHAMTFSVITKSVTTPFHVEPLRSCTE